MVVSFLIVSYNAATHLPYILEDLTRQDYPHSLIEFIFVDSMSKDDTKQVMAGFLETAKDFKRIAMVDNPKRTLPCGWNVALKEVQGDLVIRVDAHARIPHDFISKNVETIQQGEDICGGKVTSVTTCNHPWNTTLTLAENAMFGGSFAKFRRADKAQYVPTLAFAAYRKPVFDQVGPFNELLTRTEDNEMHERMKRAGFKFYYTPLIQSYRETRPSLYKLIKQKYCNGYWIGLTLGVCPSCFSWYHFVPFLFVVGILMTSLLATQHIWNPCALLWLLYGSFTIANAVITALQNKDQCGFFPVLLPFLFLGLHVFYGIGTLFGLLWLPFWKIIQKKG